MDSFTSRSNKVESCAKASMGRGFTYFALFNNGECLSSWDASSTYDDHGYYRDTKQYCYYYCFWGCYRRCYSYLTECGTGYGDSVKMNVYSFSSKSNKMCFLLLFVIYATVVLFCLQSHWMNTQLIDNKFIWRGPGKTLLKLHNSFNNCSLRGMNSDHLRNPS